MTPAPLCFLLTTCSLPSFRRDPAFGRSCEGLQLAKTTMEGSAAPRTNVYKDIVFTSNEAPPSEKIPFHHEMAQVREVAVCAP